LSYGNLSPPATNRIRKGSDFNGRWSQTKLA
jgi:hypothetical protein